MTWPSGALNSMGKVAGSVRGVAAATVRANAAELRPVRLVVVQPEISNFMGLETRGVRMHSSLSVKTKNEKLASKFCDVIIMRQRNYELCL